MAADTRVVRRQEACCGIGRMSSRSGSGAATSSGRLRHRRSPSMEVCDGPQRSQDRRRAQQRRSPAGPDGRRALLRGDTARPPVFSQAITQAGTDAGWSLSQNARAFALLTMSITDALVSSQDTKYHYVFWRPVTAIHGADTDGNPLTERDDAS